MTMPDPRGQMVAQPQFPPPGYQGGVPAQVLDPNAPGYMNQPQYVDTSFASPQSGEVETEEYGDYYGFDIRHKYVMPDGKLWIEFKVLSEGDLGRYQKLLKRDITVEKETGNARIKIDQVEERRALLMVAVVGWHMMRRTNRGWLPQTFSNGSEGSEFAKWMSNANPAIIADLADAVRKENPYILGAGPETIEAIDKQIAQLSEQRQSIIERERGEGVSASS